MDRVLGGFFGAFNRWFARRSDGYGRGVTRIVQRKTIAMGVYAVLLALTGFLFTRMPSGFVPAPDKDYLIGIVQLPAGATLDRTEAVVRRMTRHRAEAPGVVELRRLPGPVDRRLLGGAQRRP